MKDFVLSLLSRGRGQVVQTEEKNEGGRLEVCFEPEDYFNWKSQQTLLQLTRSGRFWAKDEPAPPKTYSTRRGPLVLYSQDLALSSRQPDDVSIKTRGPRHSRQEVELQVRTLRELTGAILAYGKKQPLKWYGLEDTHPSLPIPSQPKLPPPTYTAQRGLAHLNPNRQPKTMPSDLAGPPGVNSCCNPAQPKQEAAFTSPSKPPRAHVGLLPPLPEGRTTCAEGTGSHSLENQRISQTEDLKNSTEHRNQKTFTASLVVETPRVLMSPIPEMDVDVQEEHSANAEDPKEAQVGHRVIGCPGLIGPGGKCTVVGVLGAGEACPLRTACVDDSWECSPISHVTYYGGHLSGTQARGFLRHKRPDPSDRREDMASQPGLTSVHLPPLAVGALVGKDLARDGTVPPEGTARRTQNTDLRRHPETRFRKLLPPLFVTEHEEQGNSPEPQGVCDRFADRKVDSFDEEFGQNTVYTKRGDPATEKTLPTLHSNSFDPDCLGIPELGEGDVPSLGLLPPLVGCRGPGKQSSMALHRHGPSDLNNTPDPHHAESDVVKGSLPAVLKEWEKGGATGTLIMGPNGEIIRLSIWPPTDDVNSQQLLNSVIREQALSVLASEAVLDAPWTFALQTNSDVKDFYSFQSTVPMSIHLGQQNTERKGNLGGQLGTEKSQGEPPVYGEAAERTGPFLHNRGQKTATTMHLLATTLTTSTTLVGPSFSMSTNKNKPHLPPLSREVQKATIKGAREPQCRVGNSSRLPSPRHEMHHNSPPAPAQSHSDKESTVHLQASNKTLRTTTELPSAWQSGGSPRRPTLLGISATEALNTYREEAEAAETQRRGRKQNRRGKGGGTKRSSLEKYSKDSVARHKRGSVKEQGKDSGEKLRSSFVKRHKSGSVEEHRSSSRTRYRSSSITSHTRGSAERPKRGPVKEHDSGPIERHQNSSIQRHKSRSVQRHRNGSIQRTQSISVQRHRNGSIQTRQSGSRQRHTRGSVKKRGRGPVLKHKSSSLKRHGSSSVENWRQVVDKEKPHREPATQLPEGTKKLRRRKVKGEKVQKNSVSEVVKKRKKKKVKGQTEFVVGKPREWLLDGTPESSPREDVTKKVKVSTTSDSTAEDGEVGSEDSRLLGDNSDHEDCSQEEEEDWEFSYMSHSSMGGSSSSRRGTDRPMQPEAAIPPQEQVPSHGQAKLCDTIMETQDQKTAVSADTNSHMDVPNKKALFCREQQAAELAERAERRRREVERKRQEREVEKKRQQERKEREERMRLELEMEQQRRAEELRLKKLKEQEEREMLEQQELERMRREQAEKEAERRRQEENKRQLQHLMKLRQEEQERRAAELERQRVEQEAREAEEKKQLQGMEESELREYLRRQQEAEEERRRAEAERKRIEEEETRKAIEAARVQAEIFARQRAILEHKLQFQRGLLVEAEVLGLTQDISRPWVYSYFSLLNMLGLPVSPTDPEDLAKDSREQKASSPF